MARRPASAHDWLREALIAHRARLVERFDCPATRSRLERYVDEVRSGTELELTGQEIFLAVYALDPATADKFTRQHGAPCRWRLSASNQLTSQTDR